MITHTTETREVPAWVQIVGGLVVGAAGVSAVMAAAFVFWGLL